MSGAPSPELLERLRKSGLRLDAEGTWWHEGAVVEHQGLAQALHRWLDQLDDGRFIVRLDQDRYAYVSVDDAPYVVRSVTIRHQRYEIELLLSDGSWEILDGSSLAVGKHNVLYCRVKQGRFLARFSRTAYQLIAELVEAADAEPSQQYAVCLGPHKWVPGRLDDPSYSRSSANNP